MALMQRLIPTANFKQLLPRSLKLQPFDLFVELALSAEGALDLFLYEQRGVHDAVVSLIEQLIAQAARLCGSCREVSGPRIRLP